MNALPKHLALLILLSLVFTLPLQAQTGKLTGVVFDSRSGEPIIGATVNIEDSSRSAATDVDGLFSIVKLPPGLYSVTASAAGYGELTLDSVEVVAEETTELLFELIVTPKGLDKVTVTYAKPMVELSVSSKITRVGTASAPAAVAQPVQPWGTPFPGQERHAAYQENRFSDAFSEPLSTFSIDVDRASYSFVRRQLQRHEWPAPHAVRVEEMINYFPYDYEPPESASHPFSVHHERSRCPWNEEHELLRIGIKGFDVEAEELPPGNYVFLIDISGSMRVEDKLPLLVAGFRHMVYKALRPIDRVALVTYAAGAGLQLPSTPGSEKKLILRRLNQLAAAGSTAGAAGIRLAYEEAEAHFIEGGNNRIILATDGDFNVGTSDVEELKKLIAEKRKSGVYLSILGFGVGNTRDDIMEALADNGNGNYAYIDGLLESKKVLSRELSSTLLTIAKDVKLQIEFNPAQVGAYKLIGYENRLLEDEDFVADSVDAGELGAGHAVTALYEIIPPEQVEGESAVVPELVYQRRELTPAAQSEEIGRLKLRYKYPDKQESRLREYVLDDRGGPLKQASIDHRFAASVAEFGLILRGTLDSDERAFERLLRQAREARGKDAFGYRAEFVQLIEMAERLQPAEDAPPEKRIPE